MLHNLLYFTILVTSAEARDVTHSFNQSTYSPRQGPCFTANKWTAPPGTAVSVGQESQQDLVCADTYSLSDDIMKYCTSPKSIK